MYIYENVFPPQANVNNDCLLLHVGKIMVVRCKNHTGQELWAKRKPSESGGA